MGSPGPAELVRTAVAQARVATLTTYPRLGRPERTPVSVRDDAGALVLSLAADAQRWWIWACGRWAPCGSHRRAARP